MTKGESEMNKLKVQLISHTPEPDKVVAQAGKLCYSAVGVDEITQKLTEEEIARYVNMLANIGHESPLEHVSFTFAIEGISRACTHQIVRHRIASYSQQSQRYVKLEQFEYIIPPAIESNPEAKRIFIETMERDQKAYDELVDLLLEDILIDKHAADYGSCIREILKENPDVVPDRSKVLDLYAEKFLKEYGKAEKQAIEDARYVFPNACETKIVITMNARSLLHFFNVRCCNRAQWEIREMATEMLKECKKIAPALFKKAGPDCVYGKCGEGKMSCKHPRKEDEFE